MKIRVGFIGAGKVGTTLGMYFKRKGVDVIGYFSVNKNDTQKASQLTHSKSYSEVENLIAESNLIWITTTDDTIQSVATQIANLPTLLNKQKTFIHASGVHTISQLLPLQKKGFSVATAHPLFAFSNPIENEKLLDNIFFTIEKEEERLIKLLNKTKNDFLLIKSDKKPLYHLASVVLSNYLVTLSHISKQIYNQVGIENKDLNKATIPLIESVLSNIKNQGKEALTGPIRREDKETIKKHIVTLNEQFPSFLDFYKNMGLQTAKMVKKENLIDLFE